MGSTSSIVDQKQLFSQITECLEENNAAKEIEYPSKSGKTTTTENYNNNSNNDVDLYNKINHLYQKWLYQQNIEKSLIRTPLVDFEIPFNSIFTASKTPVIVDESSDNKIITYFSYQHTSILDGKKLVTDYLIRKQPLIECLDYCRRCLVNAMKHGKLLVINMGNSAPDFINTFNDDNMRRLTKVEDTNLAYFPLDVFYEGGSRLKSNEWVKRLFREEDMMPHKNFAICRDEFKVCLVSKCAPEDLYDFYFGGFTQFVSDTKREANPELSKIPLPHISNFQIVYINPVPLEEYDEEKTPRK